MAFNKSKYIPLSFTIKIDLGNEAFFKTSNFGRMRIGNVIIRNTNEPDYEIALENNKKVVKISKLNFEKAMEDLIESTWNKYHKKETV